MTSHIVRWRIARTPHQCTFCHEAIEPGQRYAAFSLPPNDYEIQNTTWFHAAGHGDTADACPSYWLPDPYADVRQAMVTHSASCRANGTGPCDVCARAMRRAGVDA